jgi:hypothetical protein
VKQTRPGGGRGTSDGGLSNVTNASVSRRGFELLIQSSSYCPLHILQCLRRFRAQRRDCPPILTRIIPVLTLFSRSRSLVAWVPRGDFANPPSPSNHRSLSTTTLFLRPLEVLLSVSSLSLAPKTSCFSSSLCLSLVR